MGFFNSSDDIEALAAEVEDNGGVYFVPAFSGIMAPRWREDARGTIVGLTRFANRNHICLLYTSPSPRDKRQSRMPSSA